MPIYTTPYDGAKEMFREEYRLFECLRRSAEIGLPVNIGFGAEPGELALGVVPGFELEVGDRLLSGGAVS